MTSNLPRLESQARALPIRLTMKLMISVLRWAVGPATILFLAPAWAAAQGGSISGNVLLPNGAFLNERARIILQTERGVKSNVFTDERGHFQFNGLTPAIYEIVVEADRERFEVARAKIEVFSNTPSILNINLKEKRRPESKSGPRVISTGELDAAIPASARKEFERGSQAAGAGKIDDAVAHFRKAIAIYPRYLMAHNDLGVQLLAQGKLDDAKEEFRRAIEIDSKAFNPHLNLGIVLVQQKDFSAAAAILKTALGAQPDSPAAILYYGLALEGSKDFEGAERALKSAHELGGAPYAMALFHLGQIYTNKGQRKPAREMFQGYLREAPNGPDAAAARKMIAALR